jgi:DNA adenine methylase
MPGERRAYVAGLPVVSPLRYPGSKRRLVPYVADVLAANSLRPELFVEPFAGGASVALQLLSDGAVQQIGIVDKDPLIAGFWRCVFWDTEWLIDQIRSVALTLEMWRKLKHSQPRTDRERALACLFLNRTSFSGILAPTAGPLGGTRQFDPTFFACRFPRATLERRVRRAANLKDRVAFVWQLDWNQAVGRIRFLQRRDHLPRGVFYYVDPPFFFKAERLYRFHFQPHHHRRLRDVLLEMDPSREPWLLSYDSLPEVQRLYGALRSKIVTVQRFYTVSRLINNHPIFAEAIVTNLAECPEPRELVHR